MTNTIGEVRGPFSSRFGTQERRYFYVYGKNGWVPFDRRSDEKSDAPARARAEAYSEHLLRGDE